MTQRSGVLRPYAEKIPCSLSIVMPVFNEEGVIADVVGELAAVLERFEHPEFVVVDDCSTDGTVKILDSLCDRYQYLLLVRSDRNRGHGPALSEAFHRSTGDYVFQTDSDRQFYAEDFWLLWKKMKIEDLDFVIGYRKDRRDSVARLVLSRMVRLWMFLLFRLKLIDSNSPLRLINRTALAQLLPVLPEQPLIPSILMVVAAYKKHLKIGWVPVRHLPRKTGKSFLRSWKVFRLCLPAVREVLRFRRDL